VTGAEIDIETIRDIPVERSLDALDLRLADVGDQVVDGVVGAKNNRVDLRLLVAAQERRHLGLHRCIQQAALDAEFVRNELLRPVWRMATAVEPAAPETLG